MTHRAIPAVHRRRITERMHAQQTRHDWLVIDAAGRLRELRSDIAELQGFRKATQANVEMLNKQDLAIVEMLDAQGLNNRFTLDAQAAATH